MPLGKNSIGSYLIGSSYNRLDGTIKSNFKARSSSNSNLSTGIILSSAFKTRSNFNSDLTTGILLKSRFKARSIVKAALSTLTNYITLSVGNEKDGYMLEQDVRTHFNNAAYPALFYITDLQNNLVSFPEITGLFLKGNEQGQFIIKTIDELIRLTSSINRTATLSSTLFLIEIKLIKSGYYLSNPPIIDNLPPVLTLNGGDITIIEGTPYTELGANAIDSIDGVVSVSINGSVNVNKTGAYQLTYTASDKAGNISVKNRMVTVIAKASISNHDASGSNASNELLIIDNTDKYIPSNIFGKDDFIKIESSVDFSVAIKLDGTLWSIGANDVGQCGLGHTNKVTSLTQITANVQTIKFIDVSLGKHHVLALSSSHILYAWGPVIFFIKCLL